MSKFGYLFVSYVFYISVLTTINAWFTVTGKPILALGFLTQWWFILIVVLIAFVSEWIALFISKEG